MPDVPPPLPPEPAPEEHPLEDLARAEELPADFEIAADFVDATFARVVADQREIAADAERVDEDPLPRELLDAYSVPEISPGFVERAATRVAADAVARAAGDAPLRQALASYAVPPSSPDFVERTLAALRVERPELRAVVQAPKTPAVAAPAAGRAPWLRRLLPPAAAAAALVAALSLFGARDPLAGVDLVSAHEFTPMPVNTQFAQHLAAHRRALDLDTPDLLIAYAQLARRTR